MIGGAGTQNGIQRSGSGKDYWFEHVRHKQIRRQSTIMLGLKGMVGLGPCGINTSSLFADMIDVQCRAEVWERRCAFDRCWCSLLAWNVMG